ncbi:MAG: VCBS repeat-containing protein, partial [Acidimicrobiia bacterium]|nr:VCBS repeat-containing protein [Acidimicrobiia bacterium]
MNRPPRTLQLAVAGLVLLTVLTTDGRASAAPSDITVGVLSSQSSKNFSAGIPAHPYAQGTDVAGREAAAMQWATTNGYNVVSLSDADLENPTVLASVDVVILPYTWAMTPTASLTVRNWIQQGGSLIPILASPRVFLDQGVWKLWVSELNYEAWEWGPLSEAYQMMFVNDPSPSSWQATLRPGHPIVTDTLADLGLASATLTRPAGSGVEFGYKYNTNVTSILDYGAVAAPFSGYNGYSAAQATRYGSGRIVYFDIPVLDYLPYYNPVLAAQPAGGGHTQGELVDSLLNSAVEWSVNGGGYGPILREATTWGEVDAYGTAIYIRQWATATGNVAVSGTLTAKVYNPAGVLVSSKQIADLGIEPGRTHMYNWSYIKGSTLDDGLYRVVLEYRYSYPEYTLVSTAEAYVQRGQGAGAITVPVAATSSEPISLSGDFDGNGSTDLGLYSPFDGKWWVLESVGSGFEPVQWADFSSAAGWEARLAGDFNGDGKDDIAQFHPSNGTWWI